MSHLGTFWKTDNCCRQHDSCPFYIEPGEYLGLLKNNGIFTRSACLCDFQFYKCLKNVNTVISRNVGITYFNILRPQCFSYDYPIKSCAKYDSSRSSHKKCIRYKLDKTKNKTLEWFDLPDF
ncbi:phospholipase A2-like [Chelonus insularis]|uniref:phospholipase A2-like n=1 Tax=Chelonus insularis TaxID=460826 RepID=UPI00158927B9|nr:phospholipase A2-like [Chelonus insularis]